MAPPEIGGAREDAEGEGFKDEHNLISLLHRVAKLQRMTNLQRHRYLTKKPNAGHFLWQ
jgi:hypothetical protein